MWKASGVLAKAVGSVMSSSSSPSSPTLTFVERFPRDRHSAEHCVSFISFDSDNLMKKGVFLALILLSNH